MSIVHLEPQLFIQLTDIAVIFHTLVLQPEDLRNKVLAFQTLSLPAIWFVVRMKHLNIAGEVSCHNFSCNHLVKVGQKSTSGSASQMRRYLISYCYIQDCK